VLSGLERQPTRDNWPGCAYVPKQKQTHWNAEAISPQSATSSDAAVLVREDIYQDRRGSPVDFTRTVWPGDTTRLVVGG
jgi:hypothetical protein